MHDRITRHSASAALEMRPGGVLVVRLSGPLTAETLHHFKSEISARHGASVRAFVADYTGAAVALSGADLDAVLEGEAPGSVPSLPAAMVVRAECVDLFAGHALRVAHRGIMRRVFCALAEAERWALYRARRTRRLGPA